jgi:hypothetical protein
MLACPKEAPIQHCLPKKKKKLTVTSREIHNKHFEAPLGVWITILQPKLIDLKILKCSVVYYPADLLSASAPLSLDHTNSSIVK